MILWVLLLFKLKGFSNIHEQKMNLFSCLWIGNIELIALRFFHVCHLCWVIKPHNKSQWLFASLGQVPFIQVGRYLVSEFDPIVAFVNTKVDIYISDIVSNTHDCLVFAIFIPNHHQESSWGRGRMHYFISRFKMASKRFSTSLQEDKIDNTEKTPIH